MNSSRAFSAGEERGTMKKLGRVCGSRCLGPMTFLPEVRGQLVSIAHEGQLALRDTSCSNHGLVFISRPVKVEEKISICIESTEASWDGALQVGFTNHCPNANLIPTTAILDLGETPGYCVVPIPKETCQTGACIELWVNHAAYVLIQVPGGKKFYMKAKGLLNVNEPLFVFLDLFGSTSAVRLLGSRKGTRTSCPDPKSELSFRERKVKEQGLVKSLFNFNKNVPSGSRRPSKEAPTCQTSPANVTPAVSTQGPDQTQPRWTSTSKDLNRNLQSSMEKMDVTSLLREFQQQYLSSSWAQVIVCRTRLLKGAIDTLSNSNFSWNKTPCIKFVGESALDHGGPRREFFRLLMIEVQSSLGIFEGKPGQLFFTYDQSALQQHKYKQAGKLIAWSIVHGGPGLQALDPCLYQLMCGQDVPLVDFDWRLIPDVDVQGKLQKILSCRKTAHIHELQRDLGDWICECGFPGIYGPVSIQDIPNIYSFVVRHYIYLRVSSMIDQFTKGLNSCGRLWDRVKDNWVDFLPIFINMKEPMSSAVFSALFQINWSRKGTNEREEEEETVYNWELVLKMIEDKKSDLRFEELLVFIMATDEVPPLGFSQKPSINFYQPEGRSCRLPNASTCMMGLYLPRGVRSQVELNTMLLRAVRESEGFGKT